ncbi:hypothetical protein AAE478_008959 [Parahypoxylon ruwenzoriense]
MDHPSRVLAQARQHLEALKQSGLSRDTLIALLGEESLPQQQQPPVVSEASTIPNFNYADVNGSFSVGPTIHRSSISSRSSCSSRDSVFSSTSARSSISSATTTPTEAKFWCTSCDKTFKRKFDWKRHEEEFHERSRKYPCPNCNQSFWGPNTFNQHHKSAHGCKTCPHADSVVKHLRKRRAWGCGFCAAMHGKFEKHIDHVAAHFESGRTKADWWHSNVIYGLLHQHLVHEAWKSLIARERSKFNGLQPMFSWSPESTGRAQGFVENENPGQLQDLLEFFDGSQESADRIVEMAYNSVHVVFRPRSGSGSVSHQAVPQSPPGPTSPSNAHKSISVLPRSPVPRRSASTSALPGTNRHNGRARNVSNGGGAAAVPPQVPNLIIPQPPNHHHHPHHRHQHHHTIANPYQSFMQPGQPPQRYTPQVIVTDKALPPAPLAPTPTSPMNLDFPMFSTDEGMLPPLDLSSDDWRSFASTLVEEEQEVVVPQPQPQPRPQHQHQQHHQPQPQHTLSGAFPVTWDDLRQFEANP